MAMKISIKTLKSDVFTINCDPSDTIGVLKEKIFASYPEYPILRQKLIFSGKVLVDESIIGETGVTERDFFVIMVTKEKPVTQAAPSAAATAAPAPVTQSPQSTFEPTTPQVVIPELSPEIRQIIDMGFPESEARAALLASNGNSSLAIEYLMSGAPIPLPPSQVAPASDLDQLRHHPQINHLRSLLQQNPGAIGQVLQEIGQQNPELLRLINSHQDEFLTMMNEPIDEDYEDDQEEHDDDIYDDEDDEGNEVNLVELLQMFQTLSEEERVATAQGLGMTVEQVQQFAQLVGTLSPEQAQQLLGGGGVAEETHNPASRHVVSLTQEEMDSVNRLMELGFSQQDAAAAFLACDKNEALAANLLLEGWTAQDLAHY